MTRLGADALVVTRAMQASTIAEIFVASDQIRVEIEIGDGDLEAFSNCLPDELFRAINGKVIPIDQRLPTFFDRDWVIGVDGQSLRGKLESVRPTKRVSRDAVTGDPLVEQPENAEVVIRLELVYELEERPKTLTIRPPMKEAASAASIGFVCYHSGLPVNDFRYLFGTQILDLDWDDPWYSRFRHPNLRRQFDAPLSAYLYVEPYEVRKEVIVRPKDLQNVLDLKLSGDGMIPVAQQQELKQRIGDFLVDNSPVMIDGRSANGKLDRIHFIRRTLRTTGIIEPPVDLESVSATLGVIIVYPIDQLPQKVTMTCELFTPRIQSIPGVASDEAGGLPTTMTPDDPVLVWNNLLTNPTGTELMQVARPPSTHQLSIPLVSVVCGGIFATLVTLNWSRRRTGRQVPRFTAPISIAALAIGVIALPFARISIENLIAEPTRLTNDEATDILATLLHNVYRSFDHHNESLIYDRLARSISGDLLAEVYLETRKSMEVKNQGGLRISVKEVSVTELEPLEQGNPDWTFQCGWRVAGNIGHWGHVHARENQHLARITIADRDGEWKITAMEMLEEVPVSTEQPQWEGGA